MQVAWHPFTGVPPILPSIFFNLVHITLFERVGAGTGKGRTVRPLLGTTRQVRNPLSQGSEVCLDKLLLDLLDASQR